MFRHGWSTRYPDSDHAAVQSSKPDPGQAWEFFWQQLHSAARTAAEVPSHALASACHALLSRSRDIAGHDHHHHQQQQQLRQRARPSFASLSGAILDRAREEASRNEHRRRTKSTGHGQQQVLAGQALVYGELAEAASPPEADAGEVDPLQSDERILISEVDVHGVDGELKKVAEQALSLKPNFAYTLKEIRGEMEQIFDTGFFSLAAPKAEDTRDGVKITVELEANPELRGVVTAGGNVLPQAVIEEAFADQYGRTLNFKSFRGALGKLNSWYEERGIFGQVTKVEMEGGVVDINLSEMVVGSLALRFVNKDTGEALPEGRTRPEVILRHLATRPGQVYNMRQASRDIDSVYSMGLFDDVNILPQAAEDSTPGCPKMDLTMNLVERKTGGLSAGGGISATGHSEGAMPGIVGSCSYSERNLFGLNQKLTATVELGQVDSLFRISHTDPWVGGDVHRTSRTVNFQNTRTSGNAIHGRAQDEAGQFRAAAADGSSDSGPDGNVIVARLLGGVEYGRPLAAGWGGTLGVNWQQAKCVDEHGRTLRQDVYGSPLTFSGGASDTMAMALLRAVYTGRRASGSDTQAVVSMEQALPLKSDWLNFNRFRARAEHTMPFGPYRLLLCGKGGMIVGDLPPYEAFPIGGTNSVRGYSEGGVGSGRNYAAGTAELHFPLFKPLQGTLFADYGTDLDSGASVTGDPAGARGKPGAGFGYGAGIRVDSPVGPLRLEYAFNQQGFRRFHLGIGSH